MQGEDNTNGMKRGRGRAIQFEIAITLTIGLAKYLHFEATLHVPTVDNAESQMTSFLLITISIVSVQGSQSWRTQEYMMVKPSVTYR